jgi:hypothetical protein
MITLNYNNMADVRISEVGAILAAASKCGDHGHQNNLNKHRNCSAISFATNHTDIVPVIEPGPPR